MKVRAPQQVDAPEDWFVVHAHNRRNVFLTGMAGTGKSTLLRRFISEATYMRVDVTASTGVAALNVGGMTLHRFCGMMLGPAAGQDFTEYFEGLQASRWRSVRQGFHRVRRCECLVIDEISMLPGRQLDFADYLFRRVRSCDKPFGGVQVIATGDFLQLPPVRTDERQRYDWAFLSEAWQAAGFQVVKLGTVRRQDERLFVEALGNFRRGRVGRDDAALLGARVQNFPPADLPRLFTHNVQVDKWNRFSLGELPGEPVVLEAETSGPENELEFLTKNLLTPARLELKPGAVVMFTINRSEPDRREPLFVNGQIGRVVSASPGGVVVESGGRRIDVERFDWKYSHEPGAAVFSQFPLRLAYAMTIHKAQGLTLDRAYVDIRAAREPGQAYVALSRVRTLDGLWLKDWFTGVCFSPDAVRFYERNGR